MAPYLVSTTEITFSSQDSVGRKAAELCAGLTEDADKVVAIHNYIASHFTYDNIFAAQVAAGQVVNYTPDTARTLETRTGICYDFSALFAAMCRSQGHPLRHRHRLPVRCLPRLGHGLCGRRLGCCGYDPFYLLPQYCVPNARRVRHVPGRLYFGGQLRTFGPCFL